MTVKELKKGEYFTKKDILYPKDSQVFIRGDYDRSAKKYECIRFSDCNDKLFYSAAGYCAEEKYNRYFKEYADVAFLV